MLHTVRHYWVLPRLHPHFTQRSRAALLLHETYPRVRKARRGGTSVTPYDTVPAFSRPDEDVPTSPQHSRSRPAPWMPLGPLTELWAAFSKQATSREALLAASEAFAALADDRQAIHNPHWLPLPPSHPL